MKESVMLRTFVVVVLSLMVCGSMFAQKKSTVPRQTRNQTPAEKKQQGEEKSVSIRYPEFVLAYHPNPQSDNQAALPLVSGSLLRGSKERFGFFLSGQDGASFVFEISDATGMRKGITVNDLLGKPSNSGVRVLESYLDPAGQISSQVFELQFPGGPVEFVLRAVVSGVEGNTAQTPQLLVSTTLRKTGARKFSVRWTLNAEGNLEAKGNNFSLASRSGSAGVTALLSPNDAKLTVEGPKLTISSAMNIWLIMSGSRTAGAANVKNELLNNLAEAEAKKNEPNVVIVTSMDKKAAQPKDTVTVTLTCMNIGNAAASNVVMSNPIPQGTSFLEGSAFGETTVISFVRSGGALPALGSVSSVSWRVNGDLMAGEERVAGFKVIVQ